MIANPIEELCRLVPLGPWIDRAAAARVPFIPAVWSPAIPVSDMWGALDEPHTITPALKKGLDWVDKALKDAALANVGPVMVRWECCTGSDVKFHASRGDLRPEQSHLVLLDDPRVFDCTVGETTRLCIRPWETAMLCDNYPVEFRVFIGKDGYLGTSSYYPQRPLPQRFRCYVLGVCDRAESIWLENGGRQGFPMGCTMDFLIREDGQPLFLEGGPPHQTTFPLAPSSHPCCFAEGAIDGIALARRAGALSR